MRPIVPVLALALAASSMAFAQSAPDRLDQPSYEKPAKGWTDVEEAARKDCADRIRQARATAAKPEPDEKTAGKPELDYKPAEKDQALHHYAVDTRVDGCGVLVPVSDPADLREVPAPSQELKRIPVDNAD